MLQPTWLYRCGSSASSALKVNKMGCPMFERKAVIQRPVEYPFEELYRPWSWALSSISNLIIFALLILLCYALIKRYFNNKKEIGKLSYRRVINENVSDVTESKVRVLVTGGCGSLGKRLVQNLIKDGGYDIHSLDLFIPDEEDRISGISSYISANITNPEDVLLALRQTKVEAVFHVAGLISKVGTKDSDLYHVNQTGTEIIVNVCKEVGVARLIYTSTCDVLMSGDRNEILDNIDEMYPLPKESLNAYCGSKKGGEKIVLKANSDGFNTCSLRCSIIGSPSSVMFEALLHNRGAYVGDGTNKLSFVDVDMCAQAHIQAEKKLRDGMTSIAAGQVYHIAGDSCTIKDIMSYTLNGSIDTIWGFPPPFSISRWIATFIAVLNVMCYQVAGYAPFHSGLDLSAVDFATRSYSFNADKAHRELDWPTQPTWQDIVQKIVREYHEQVEAKKTK